MRWHSAHALSDHDLVNLCQGRIIEHIYTNVKVPVPEGGSMIFPFVFKLLGVDGCFSVQHGEAYAIRYWKPV